MFCFIMSVSAGTGAQKVWIGAATDEAFHAGQSAERTVGHPYENADLSLERAFCVVGAAANSCTDSRRRPRCADQA